MKNAWTGCNECDVSFECWDGAARCIRLPKGEWLGTYVHKDGEVQVYAPTEKRDAKKSETPRTKLAHYESMLMWERGEIQEAIAHTVKVSADIERDLIAANTKLDALLAHCPDAECMVCGAIICPHGEPLHFHHDGCPACAELNPK